jgi:hypothetical protein
MSKHLAAVTLAALLTGIALAEGPKSGPQVGDRIPGPFNPYNVNGEDAGLKRCQV